MSQTAVARQGAPVVQAIDTPWARGTVAAGFEPVAAAFAIIHRGETVVDLQGGFRDKRRTHGIGARKLA